MGIFQDGVNIGEINAAAYVAFLALDEAYPVYNRSKESF
jgi:hypothetical protein